MRRLFVLVAAVILVDTMFYAAIVPLLPEYADELGLSKTAAGVLSASYAAGTLLAALPSGWLAARIGVRPTMLVGLGAARAARASSSRSPTSIVVLDLARFAQGVGGACAWTGGLAWLLAAGPARAPRRAVGSALAVAIAGLLLGPVIGGDRDRGRPRAGVQRGRGARPRASPSGCFATPGLAPRPMPGAAHGRRRRSSARRC